MFHRINAFLLSGDFLSSAKIFKGIPSFTSSYRSSASYVSSPLVSIRYHTSLTQSSEISANSIQVFIEKISQLQYKDDILSFQQAVEHFSSFLINDIFCTEPRMLKLLSAKLTQVNYWIIRSSILKLLKLQNISHKRASGTPFIELENFPPQLVYTMLKFVLAWKKLHFYVHEQKLCKHSKTSIVKLVQSSKLSELKKILILLQIRLKKIIPHMSLHECASIIHFYSLFQPKNTTLINLFSNHLNKKLWHLSHQNAAIGPHEIAKGISPENALLVVLVMAKTKTPANRCTHELAHALVPVIVTQYLENLSICSMVTLLSTFAKYHLQNQYHGLLYHFCKIVSNHKAEAKHIVNAISSIVKIPETPVEVIVFLYNSLIQSWGVTANKQHKGEISFRPLLNLIDTDFSCWGNVFEMLMAAMQEQLGDKIKNLIAQTSQQITEQKGAQEILKMSTDVLHGLATRQWTLPSHSFTNLLLRLNITHLKVMNNINLNRFLKSMAQLHFYGCLPQSLDTPENIETIVCAIVESLEKVDARGLPYAIFLVGFQDLRNQATCLKNTLLRKWISFNSILNGKALAMSIHGLGCMKLDVNEMQKKAIASICEKKFIRNFDCKEIMFLCMGLKGLDVSIQEYPEPYMHCIRRTLDLSDSMDISSLPHVLSVLAHCGMINSKLNIRVMRRIIRESEFMDFDVFLELTEVLFSVLGEDRAHYTEDIRKIYKLIRDKIFSEIHTAKPIRCVRMMNLCSTLMPYDTSLIRCIAFTINSFASEMIPFISKIQSRSPQIILKESQNLFLTAPALLSILPYTPPLSSFESCVVEGIGISIDELQPTELQRLMYMTIGPMCESLQPARGLQYVFLYERSRWLVIDSLLDKRSSLSKRSLALQKIYPESISSLLLSMCDNQFCDWYFLTVFLRSAKNAVQCMHVQMLLLCVSCLSELALLCSHEFRFFIKIVRNQAEIKAEEFNAENIRAFLHLLYASEIKTSSRLTTFLGERAIEILNF